MITVWYLRGLNKHRWIEKDLAIHISTYRDYTHTNSLALSTGRA